MLTGLFGFYFLSAPILAEVLPVGSAAASGNGLVPGVIALWVALGLMILSGIVSPKPLQAAWAKALQVRLQASRERLSANPIVWFALLLLIALFALSGGVFQLSDQLSGLSESPSELLGAPGGYLDFNLLWTALVGFIATTLILVLAPAGSARIAGMVVAGLLLSLLSGDDPHLLEPAEGFSGAVSGTFHKVMVLSSALLGVTLAGMAQRFAPEPALSQDSQEVVGPARQEGMTEWLWGAMMLIAPLWVTLWGQSNPFWLQMLYFLLAVVLVLRLVVFWLGRLTGLYPHSYFAASASVAQAQEERPSRLYATRTWVQKVLAGPLGGLIQGLLLLLFACLAGVSLHQFQVHYYPEVSHTVMTLVYLVSGGVLLGFGMVSMLGMMRTSQSEHPPDAPMATLLLVLQTVLMVGLMGIALWVSARLDGMVGLLVLACGLLFWAGGPGKGVSAESQSTVITASQYQAQALSSETAVLSVTHPVSLLILWILGRVMLQGFMILYSNNVTGINLLHAYTGLGLFGGIVWGWMATWLHRDVLTAWATKPIARFLVAGLWLLLSLAVPLMLLPLLHSEATASFMLGGLLVTLITPWFTFSSFTVSNTTPQSFYTFSTFPIGVMTLLVISGVLAGHYVVFGEAWSTLWRLGFLVGWVVVAVVLAAVMGWLIQKTAKALHSV